MFNTICEIGTHICLPNSDQAGLSGKRGKLRGEQPPPGSMPMLVFKKNATTFDHKQRFQQLRMITLIMTHTRYYRLHICIDMHQASPRQSGVLRDVDGDAGGPIYTSCA